VSRPNVGLVYCGCVVPRASGAPTFCFVNDPPWYDRYMQLRSEVDDAECWHAADVCQTWQLEKVVPIPFPLIPAWIRRSLLGRATYGRIYSDAELGDPHEIMHGFIDGRKVVERSWTLDEGEIARRLLYDFGPSTFEHLVVALLQLENPDQIWVQIGGSGDGGIDGVGSTSSGVVTALLQCKWEYGGGDPFSAETVWKKTDVPFQRILASLRHPQSVNLEGVTFLGRREIAALVASHHARLPWATAMRVGLGKS